MSDGEIDLEYVLSPGRDALFQDWLHKLSALSSSTALLRHAAAATADGRRIKDLQVRCSPRGVRPVRENVSMIATERVLLAEVDEVHVGFCVAHEGSSRSAPLFIQLIGVAPEAQRRGIGLALITAAAALAPQRDIALATQDSNASARALNQRFASPSAHISGASTSVFTVIAISESHEDSTTALG